MSGPPNRLLLHMMCGHAGWRLYIIVLCSCRLCNTTIQLSQYFIWNINISCTFAFVKLWSSSFHFLLNLWNSGWPSHIWPVLKTVEKSWKNVNEILTKSMFKSMSKWQWLLNSSRAFQISHILFFINVITMRKDKYFLIGFQWLKGGSSLLEFAHTIWRWCILE